MPAALLGRKVEDAMSSTSEPNPALLRNMLLSKLNKSLAIRVLKEG
jgi:hypothetical protein